MDGSKKVASCPVEEDMWSFEILVMGRPYLCICLDIFYDRVFICANVQFFLYFVLLFCEGTHILCECAFYCANAYMLYKMYIFVSKAHLFCKCAIL